LNKEQQRVAAKKTLGSMSESALNSASVAISTWLGSLASIESSTTILAYLPLAQEVDLQNLMRGWIEEGKTVCVPVANWEDNTMQAVLLTSMEPEALIESKHGLREPKERFFVPTELIDIVLVPGLAFDASGGRLGRGGGFYDRFLARTRPPMSIGVAFDEQMVDRLHLDPHDILLTAIATPKGLITS
jgi:5-formyltetrahydrofolate cyclo-ligase